MSKYGVPVRLPDGRLNPEYGRRAKAAARRARGIPTREEAAAARMRACKVKGCERRARSRGWCIVHYHRWYQNGDPLALRPLLPVCSVEGCGAIGSRREALCRKHLARLRATGTTDDRVWEVTSYETAHDRVRRVRGSADKQECVGCGRPAKHWAYAHGSPDERRSGLGPWSPNPDDYIPLCVPCHKAYDMQAYRNRRRRSKRPALGRYEREMKSIAWRKGNRGIASPLVMSEHER